jgi:hypothetical protein
VLSFYQHFTLIQKRFGKILRPFTRLVPYWFGSELGKINATLTSGRISSASVKDQTGEHRYATGGRDDRISRIVTEIAYAVIGFRVSAMLNEFALPKAAYWKDIDRAVGFVDIVERTPTGNTLRMITNAS